MPLAQSVPPAAQNHAAKNGSSTAGTSSRRTTISAREDETLHPVLLGPGEHQRDTPALVARALQALRQVGVENGDSLELVEKARSGRRTSVVPHGSAEGARQDPPKEVPRPARHLVEPMQEQTAGTRRAPNLQQVHTDDRGLGCLLLELRASPQDERGLPVPARGGDHHADVLRQPAYC